MLNHLNWLHSGPTLSSLWMSDPATQWRKLISATCNRDPILSGHYPKLVTTGEGKLGEVTGKLHQIQSACPSHATFYPHLMRLKSGKHPLKISWWEMYGKEWKEFRQPHDLLPPKTPETCSQLLQVFKSLQVFPFILGLFGFYWHILSVPLVVVRTAQTLFQHLPVWQPVQLNWQQRCRFNAEQQSILDLMSATHYWLWLVRLI